MVACDSEDEDLSDKQSITHFGNYEVIERISAGGMAEIFKAKKEGLGGFQRMFALKRVSPEYAGNEVRRHARRGSQDCGLAEPREYRQIVDLGQIDDQPYIAMGHINGPTSARPSSACVRGTTFFQCACCLHLLGASEGLGVCLQPAGDAQRAPRAAGHHPSRCVSLERPLEPREVGWPTTSPRRAYAT